MMPLIWKTEACALMVVPMPSSHQSLDCSFCMPKKMPCWRNCSLPQNSPHIANVIFPEPCSFDADSELGQIGCVGWFSHLGDLPNQIQIAAPCRLCGQGQRKLASSFCAHPQWDRQKAICCNANSTCCSSSSNGESEVDDSQSSSETNSASMTKGTSSALMIEVI